MRIDPVSLGELELCAPKAARSAATCRGSLDAVAAGDAVVPIHQVYGFDEVVAAHETMEAGTAAGRLVVTVP